MADLLTNLNPAQRDAVSSPARQLAILAGPGSGKTHTLTSRVAFFLQSGMAPQNIIVATFTRKAALEMKERISKLLGDDRSRRLVLGTFHSIALKYLYTYGHLIGLRKAFEIADSADSLSVLKRILKRRNWGHRDAKNDRAQISTKKAKGGWDEKLVKRMSYDSTAREIETVYTEYEEALKRDNLLDYDDLLLRCVQLLREHPRVVKNVEAVLIDEFQDTNLVQFDLMRLLAAQRKKITVVGDPDQSIYGFRAAEAKNYGSLLRQYPDTLTISLEENYRSSGQILGAAMKVIQQDNSRIQKTLKPTHGAGTKPVLRTLADADVEGEWIAVEIKRVLALTAGLLDHNSIAVLVRSAYLSRTVENGFAKAGIPYRMVGGQTFYDRIEIKILLNYMRIVNNPRNNETLVQVINEPKRGVGDITVEKLLAEATKKKVAIWDLVQKGPVDTAMSKIASNGIKKFIKIVTDAQALDTTSILELLEHIIDAIGLEKHLQKIDQLEEEKFQSRMENVREFLTIAREADESGIAATDEPLPDIEGVEQDALSTPLSDFLANITLATDKRAADASDQELPRVTISTMHSAKGLEWPVVFVPGCYEGGVPNARGAEENMDEERRIFFVAMTRAKALLYLTTPLERYTYSEGKAPVAISNFVAGDKMKRCFARRGPSFRDDIVEGVAKILRLPKPAVIVPDEAVPLLSLEDDVFPEDGSSRPRASRWDSSGSALPPANSGFSRPQLVEKKSDGPFVPSYTTTMASMPGFSTAKRVLDETPANLSFTPPSRKDPTLLESGSDDLPELPMGKKRKVADEPGQQKIAGFLGLPPGPKASTMTGGKENKVATAPKTKRSLPWSTAQPAFSSARGTGVAASSQMPKPAIDPSLTQHRVGAQLPAVRRGVRQNTPPKGSARTHVNIISSSPVRPSSASKPSATTSMPAPSYHNTTMSNLSARGGGNRGRGRGGRTLGVKRSVDGWAKRGAGKWEMEGDKARQVYSPPRCGRCRSLVVLCSCEN